MENTMLKNITKMLEERKFLDKKNHESNLKKLIKQNNEDKVYNIKSDFNNKKTYIMFITGKLTTTKKVPGIQSFIDSSKLDNRLFVIDNVNQKIFKQLLAYNNSEVFFDYELLVNVIDHHLQPRFEVLSNDEKKNFFKQYNTKPSEMPKMFSTDIIARYYKLIDGDIVRIIRPSITSGYTVFYRIVVKMPIALLFK